jgi:transcription elongation factor GreB
MRLEDPEGNQTIYRIVGPDEFDVSKGYISMDSPVGRALLGREQGSEVVVKRPKGAVEYVIVEVSRSPLR